MPLVFLTRLLSAGGICTAGQSRNYVASRGLLKEGVGGGGWGRFVISGCVARPKAEIPNFVDPRQTPA